MTAIQQWDMFELPLPANFAGNPFNDLTLTAEFTHGGRSVRVSGFYDGDDTWRVRFMPDLPGEWRYRTASNLPALDGQAGSFTCVPPSAGNHGPVRVNGTHFIYADGTPYHPVGTTCYVWNHQGAELEARTLKTLSTAPFNKMRMCVFPKRYLFSKNEPPDYPFPGQPRGDWQPAMLFSHEEPPPQEGWDYARFNPSYFQRLERHVAELGALGIEADLIVFHPYDSDAWGFDRLPPEVNDRYLRYLAARLSAYRNVWWSLANEYDLMRNRTPADWDHFFRLLQAEDPYGHLRSVHNGITFYDHALPWVTHCSIQSDELLRVPQWLQQYAKPVVIDECGYEGDILTAWGSLSAEALVESFWLGFTAGGYVGHGETYMNPEERLWWSKGGELSGQSPARIAFLRQVIEAVPGAGLLPAANNPQANRVFGGGVYKGMAAGYAGQDYYLLYLARHQPRLRFFNLPEGGNYRIDLLDTWNMTVECLLDNASGRVELDLPGRLYLAVRITKN